MEFSDAVSFLDKNDEFQSWKKSHEESYFSYAFRMLQDQDQNWQLGYYDRKEDKVTTFVVNGIVKRREEEEMFKKEDTEIVALDLKKVTLKFDQVIDLCHEFQEKNYPRDKSTKTIAILQHLKEYGMVWNITFITETFNTLNMKVDPHSGEVVDHKLSSIFSFKAE